MLTRYLIVAALSISACWMTAASQTSSQQDVVTTAPAKQSSPDMADLLRRANSGDASAQFELARAYETGGGLRENQQPAVLWYRKAAEQGNSKAQNSLGVLYWSGNGVERNKQEAMEWYRKAARQGDANAMFNIGAAYYK